MKSETIEKLYKEIKELAFEIGKIGLPEKFLEIARNGQRDQKEIIFKEFTADNPKLSDRLSKLHKNYRAKGEPVIFHRIESAKYYKYDPKDIKPANLFIVIMFSAIEYNIFYDEYTFGNTCFEAEDDECFEQYELLEKLFSVTE